jgi:hypothetical protein
MRNFIDIMESITPPKPYTATLYHGTPHEFSEFDHEKTVSSGPFGNGVYLTNDLGLAKEYADGGTPMRVKVTLRKPYHIDLSDYAKSSEQRRPFRSAAGKQQILDDGYDGVVVKEGAYIEVVAYRGAKLVIQKPVDQG